MVSYGDNGFRNWADENGFNDRDLALIGREVNKRKWLWVLIWLLCFLVYVGQSGTVSGVLANICTVVGSAAALILWFGCSFACKCISMSRMIKYGTMDPKPGLLGMLFGIMLFFTWLSIIPLIITLVSRKKVWGTGINKLIKKGMIGNH